MGKPYSLDLRHRICGYIAAGNSCRAAGRVFGVSAATAVRYGADQRERGAVAPKPQGRPSGRFGKLVSQAGLTASGKGQLLPIKFSKLIK